MAVRAVPDSPTASAPVTVPRFTIDPVASLRPLPAVVQCGGQKLHIPALPAADWLEILFESDIWLEDIFPGMLEDSEPVEELLAQGKLTVEELRDIAFDILEIVSGKHWWVTLRLVKVAHDHWDSLNLSVDAGTVSLGLWLDVVLHSSMACVNHDKLQEFLFWLEAPPPGETVEEETIDANQFMAMMSD